MTDAELVSRVRQGDSEAYTELVDHYRNAVYGLAYHYLQNFEDARDVAQEVFVQAYLHLGQLRDSGKFGPWLRQMTHNQCRMWQRQQHRTEPLESLPAVDSAVDSHVEQVDARLAVQEALACLSRQPPHPHAVLHPVLFSTRDRCISGSASHHDQESST